jgi:hypothetical protein
LSPLVHPDVDTFDLLTILGVLPTPVRLGIVVRLFREPGPELRRVLTRT